MLVDEFQALVELKMPLTEPEKTELTAANEEELRDIIQAASQVLLATAQALTVNNKSMQSVMRNIIQEMSK